MDAIFFFLMKRVSGLLGASGIKVHNNWNMNLSINSGSNPKQTNFFFALSKDRTFLLSTYV